MATQELTSQTSNGPITSNSRIIAAVNGLSDPTLDAISPSLIYDFIKTQTDTLYPTQAELSSLNDYVTSFTLQKDDADNTKWDGQNLIARGFAEATSPTDLVTYQQLQDAVLAVAFDIPGLDAIDTVDSTADLLLLYDVSAGGYRSASPNQLISGLDPDLGAIAALTGTGFGARTASDTWALRSLTQPASGLTIANPAGIAGDPTFALANDLAALEALGSTGFATRTASDTWAQRTLQQPASGLTITNPAGVAGDPTFALANDLAALEALSGTNTIPYRSGVDTWGGVTIGSLLSFSAGTLDIGDAELTAIAGLTSASNRMPYFTGSGTAALLTLDTDGTLAANSDTTLATQKAVKTYVDQIVAAQDAMVFKGVIDCSANPNYPAADRGHTYRVSVAGKIGGASGTNVEVGDILICLTDSTASGNQATVGTSWTISQANLDGAVIGPSSATDSHFAQFDGTTGKLLKGGLSLDTDGTLSANSATRVPSQSAVKTYAQPLDATLTALAGVATAADKLIYATGSDAFTTTDLSSFARTLIDDADAATARSTLGLVIGTNVQAFDAELAALAGLTSAADKLPYWTGSGTAANADFTTFGRSLVDDANAAAARTTLGLVIGTDVQAYHARLADIAGITYAQGDILYYNGSAIVKLAAGTTGQVLQTSGVGANPVWATVSGTGDVTAASVFATDNRLIRSDGTGKGVQASGITVDDSNNVSGLASLALPTVPFSGIAAPINLSLAVSASASALTIAIKGADGNDASSTNPVYIPYRSATGATGSITWRTLSAASSIVVSSGSTLGITSSTAFRIWVVMFDDAGTLRPGVIVCGTSSSSQARICALANMSLASSTAEGGAGAADNAQTFYTGTAVTSKPYSILGYAEWSASGVTAGTWTTTNLSLIQTYGPGVKLPGDIVQVVSAYSASGSSATTTTFTDVTGSTMAITLTSPANFTKVQYTGSAKAAAGGAGVNTEIFNSIARGGSVVGPQTQAGVVSGAGTNMITDGVVALTFIDFANSATSISYTCQQKGLNASGACTTSGLYGCVAEIMT